MKKIKQLCKVLLSISLAVIISSNCMLIAGSKTRETEADNVSKISDKLYEVMDGSSDSEKIPVSIWYEDIDQYGIDDKTKEETGYSINDLSANMENDILSIDSVDQLNSYISKTEKQRKTEKARTDNFISKRRELSRTEYEKAVNYFVDKVSISDEDIIFKSQYAPIVIANLTSADIKSVSENKLVQDIDYYEEPKYEECTKESISSNTNYTQLYSELGLTGAGIKVGIIENGYPTADSELDLTKIHDVNTSMTASHAANTAKIIVGSDSGFAQSVDLYSTDHNYQNVETMLTMGVQLINISLSWAVPESDTTDNYFETFQDKWYNHIVSYHNVTVVASAGNDGQGSVDSTTGAVYRRVASPAAAHNVIAVGAYDDKNTADKSDDILYSYSSYKNSNGEISAVEKPDVVMSANIGGNGTSSSAPVLTAMLALMFELKPSIAAYPQAAKSIVMASCDRKIASYESDSELYNGITDKQGAGAPNVMLMADIICQGTYGIGTIEGDETEDSRRFVQLPYGASDMNVCISWLKENTGDCNNNVYTVSNVDLDLSLLRDGTEIAISDLENSAAELITTPLTGSGNYEMIVDKYTENYTETVRYGYAYCSDMAYSTEISEEGIYYLKDSFGTYITLDSDGVSTCRSAFTGDVSQQWVLSKNSDNYLLLMSGKDSSDKALGHGTEVATGVYKAILNDNPLQMTLHTFETTGKADGSAYLYCPMNGRYLTGSTPPLFATSTTIASNCYWQLEKVNYHLGDIDLDGELGVDDALMIQKYLAKEITLNNTQKYLADYNNDGTVNVTDVTDLQMAYL